MNVTQTIKIVISIFGVGLLISAFVVPDEMLTMVLISGSIICALIPHMIPSKETEVEDVPPQRPKPISVNVYDAKAKQEAELRQQKLRDEKKKQLVEEYKKKMAMIDQGDEPQEQPQQQEEVEEEPEDVLYTCPKCKKQFPDKKKLQRHIGMAHYMDVKI